MQRALAEGELDWERIEESVAPIEDAAIVEEAIEHRVSEDAIVAEMPRPPAPPKPKRALRSVPPPPPRRNR